MNWVASRLLMLCPAWVAACTVYNQDLLGADGGDGGTSMSGSGASTGSGATGSSSGGSIASGGKPNGSGGTTGNGGSSNTSGGSDNAGGADGGSNGSGGSNGGSSGGTGGDSGGSAGTSGSGGSGGSGPPKTYTYELIDDFEDGDAAGDVTADRNPTWFLFKDTTAAGVLLPEEFEGAAIPEADAEARPDSSFGVFISTTGFTSWGSGVGVDFVNPKDVYDASAYAGIRFYAKATTTFKTVRVNVSQVLTDASQDACDECDDHFGVTLPLTEEWKEYKLLFADLKREGWGDPVDKLHLDELLGVMFLVKANKSVDFWIDDISLMKEEPTAAEANVAP